MLYAFGSNGSGQLGLRDREDKSKPEPCVFPVDYESEVPVRIAAGGNHTLVLLRSGIVLAAGSNERGQCSRAPEGKASIGFKVLSIPGDDQKHFNFKACSATWEASTLVTQADDVYTFGSGSKGELGQGESITVSAPRQLSDFPPAGATVIDISSCMGHTVVVLSNGEVYGWGNGRKGQLGEPTGVVWSPRKVGNIPFKAFRAVCGREFTHVVGPPDTGHHAILGSDKLNIRSSAPPRVEGWKDVSASWGSIFVLLRDGTLISWGRDDHGQVPSTSLPKLSKIAAGSEHCLAQSTHGKVLAWGWGEHGNCGPFMEQGGDVKNRRNEVEIDNDRVHITGVGAGCATSWVLVGP